MKHLTISITMAAAVVLAAGSASAQTLKAEIPFTFQVGDAVMSPGTYNVSLPQNSASRHLVLRNAETKASVLAQYSPDDASKAWKARGTPVVRFVCSGARCVLSEMWAGYDAPAYIFRAPKIARDGDMRIADIGMSVIKAD